jgi:hypothetical protein
VAIPKGMLLGDITIHVTLITSLIKQLNLFITLRKKYKSNCFFFLKNNIRVITNQFIMNKSIPIPLNHCHEQTTELVDFIQNQSRIKERETHS